MELSEHKENGKDRLSAAGETLHFHYSREERLKKLRRDQGRKRPRFFSRKSFSKKSRKALLIIFVDILLVGLVFYFLHRPVNVYMQKKDDGILYELNVTEIKGKKVLIGFTIKNQTEEGIDLVGSPPVRIKLVNDGTAVLTLHRNIEHDAMLLSGESSSVIFLVDGDDLPRTARLELYYHSDSFPLFERNMRF